MDEQLAFEDGVISSPSVMTRTSSVLTYGYPQ